MSNYRKGDVSLVSFVVIFSIIILLIVVVAPLLSEASFSANLQANQANSINQYRAHATMAAITQNDELMTNITNYTVSTGSTKDELRTQINSTIVEVLESQSPTYLLELKRESVDRPSIRFDSGTDRMRFSDFNVPSPSSEEYTLVIGVGDHFE